MNRIYNKIQVIAIILLIILASCSTKKNTAVTRAYHNLTAKYNVLFNGTEAYKKGLKRVDETFKDDYSRILPVFNYGNKNIAASISSDMDVAIKKSTKCIALHSIKVKPDVKRGKMTAQEKEFYNKNEYNKWIDNAYMLIGKAHFYKMDYQNATETYNFIFREFPKEQTRYEGKIWLARTDAETGEYKDAEIILSDLETDKKFPKKFNLDLATTRADFALKQNQYQPAIKSLEKALELVHKKKLKLRYMFILAQLYQKTEQSAKAIEMYKKIIRKNPPYEMTFNAQINLASSVENGSKDNRAIKKQLQKMLRNNKNIDYQDQIYFAMGNISIKEGNKPEGVDYYKKSVKASTKNNDQKALSCLTLADIYYIDKEYLPAQAYYDSSLLYLSPTYPGIADIKLKASSLNSLVENLNATTTEDSLQRVAKMPEAERIRFIDGIITNLKQKEAEAQIAESQRLQQYYNNQARQSMMPQDNSGKAKWYFYNPISVSQGIKEFQLRWGRRRLEDNWRRRNKGIVGIGEQTELASDKKQDDKKKVLDNKSREFYIQNLPLTDSLMKVSKKKELDGYYNAGLVYRNDLKDNPQAIALYEKMLARFPETDYTLPVYFQLYGMYKENKNESKASYYKNLILTKYPNSNYAKLMSDPEYYKQYLEKEKEADRFYEQTYNLYNAGNYQQVIANAQTAVTQYKNNPVLAKFALIKAMAIGKTSDKMAFRDELNIVIKQYPNNEVTSLAKDMIAYLNAYQPETKQKEDIKVAEIIYSAEENTPYYFALVIDKQEDVNQVVFDLINFNLDNFANDKLELSNEAIGKSLKVVLVKTFPDKDKALAYFKAVNDKTEVLKNVKNGTKHYFIISPANLQVLQKQESVDSYLQFFKSHFE